MNIVRDIVINHPDTKEISLEGCGLSNLEECLPELLKLRNLETLRLSNNFLTKLPSDLSGMKKLIYLDISGNNFHSPDAVLPGLLSLPKLRHLYIDVSGADEDELVVSLTNLDTFNGTPLSDVTEDDVEDEDNDSKLYSNNGNDSILNTSTGNAQKSKSAPREMTKAEKIQEELKKEKDVLKQHILMLASKRTNVDERLEKIIQENGDKDVANDLEVIMHDYASVFDGFVSLLEKMNQEYLSNLKKREKDLEHADQKIGELLEAAEIWEKESKDCELAKKKLAEQFEAEKEKLIEEVGWLKAENEKMKNKMRQYQLNRQKISASINTSAVELLQSSGKEKKDPKKSIQYQTNKSMTLRQTKDMIEEIYASKTKFDQKCSENRLPRETMEQHLYTFLNQKYGLKNLILEWAAAIMHAVKKYSIEDNDVAVFGKILRNEVDEEFRFVQKQLRETVAELLRVYLKGKYPMKQDSEINQMLAKRMEGFVNEEEWVDIIKYMYNKEDSVNVIIKVKEAIRKQNTPSRQRSQQRDSSMMKSQNKILYTEFVRVLLNFQLKGHERFLHKFVKLFRQFDDDRDGVLNELEFRNLLLSINPNRTEEEIDTLLQLMDPYNNQSITFSECVTFLSAELVRMMNEKQQQFNQYPQSQSFNSQVNQSPISENISAELQNIEDMDDDDDDDDDADDDGGNVTEDDEDERDNGANSMMSSGINLTNQSVPIEGSSEGIAA